MIPLSNIDIVIRVSVAVLSGFFIGLERQLNNSVAGIHTNVLVCIGSCLFIFVGNGLEENNSPSRIAAQVVTGIGFIGSGMIIKDVNQIKGINTAATVWCSAAIGCLCGCGYWLSGLLCSLVISVLNFLLRDEHIKMFATYAGGNKKEITNI